MKRIISTLLGAIMMIACYAATAQELGPTLKKIKGLLTTAVSTDEATKAHRAMLVFLIDKATTVK